MEELISVIVPIYKVEDYLSKCINSIRNQTYRNLEIILVDDGSPDNCPEICDEFAKRDERVRVIHSKNSGLAAARNKGLDIIKGTYIAFVDSDDYIDERMFEVLYKNIKKYNADLSICDFIPVFIDGKFECTEEYDESKEIITVCNRQETFEKLHGDSYVKTIVAWNKLYKKELFDDIRYDFGKSHEDEFIIHKIIDKSKTVVYSSSRLYYYVQRDTSIMGKKFNLSRLDVLEALENRMLYFKQKGFKDLYTEATEQYLNQILICYQSINRFYPNEKELSKNLKSKFFTIYNEHRHTNFSSKSSFSYVIFCINPYIHKLILDLYRKIQYYKMFKLKR